MGFLDGLLGRNPRKNNDDRIARQANDSFFEGTTTTRNQEKSSPVEVFIPTSFNDVEKIIDTMRSGKNAIVQLGNLKPNTKLRVLDMLSGAFYALGGGLYEIQKNSFMFSPDGFSLK